MNPQNINSPSTEINQTKNSNGNSVVYSSQAFTAEYFKLPDEGVLTLYANGQLEFTCTENPKLSVNFGVNDIQFANFGFGGAGSAIFTLNSGAKHNFTFGDFVGAGVVGTVGSVASNEIGGALGAGALGAGTVVESQAVGASIQGSLDWQKVLEQYLPPEKIKKGSKKKFVLWVGIAVIVPFAVIVLVVSLLSSRS